MSFFCCWISLCITSPKCKTLHRFMVEDSIPPNFTKLIINNSIASFVTKLGSHYIKYPDICRNYTFLNQMEFILHQLEMTYF